ncbi:MAG: transglutaminase domain-containing protein [Eubacteriales bacterium]|nr:transglutaminase domain-containing protein [Eubacteriales bacterium]
MQRKKAEISRKLCAFLTVLCLVFGVIPAQAVQAAGTAEITVSVKNGWVKESDGYRYYVNGKMQKNRMITVGTKKYYVGSDGVRKTGWYTVGNKSYYFNSKGILTKSKTIDKALVTRMDKVIKGQKITDNTADKTALKKLFIYVQTKCNYSRVMGFKAAKNWEYEFASEMLTKKKGSCYHYAAAFAFLAKRATGLPTRICWGTSNAFNTKVWQPHAWVEIKINGKWYTYDPNAARYSKLRKGRWYQQPRTSMTGKIYKMQKTVNVEL